MGRSGLAAARVGGAIVGGGPNFRNEGTQDASFQRLAPSGALEPGGTVTRRTTTLGFDDGSVTVGVDSVTEMRPGIFNEQTIVDSTRASDRDLARQYNALPETRQNRVRNRVLNAGGGMFSGTSPAPQGTTRFLTYHEGGGSSPQVGSSKPPRAQQYQIIRNAISREVNR